MSTPARPNPCPDAETLAAFAEGLLPREGADAVLAHVDECDDCLATLEALNETIATRNDVGRVLNPAGRAESPSYMWLAVAASALLVVTAVVLFRYERATPISRLVALSQSSTRPVEPRLSGGFPWASYRGPMRAEESDADPRRMRLIGAAGDIVAAADRDRSADAQQSAGVALLVIDKPEQAIERLQAAVQASPKDAAAWSDLAAAQYAAALRLNRPSLLPDALASADRALRIDARHVEARFNRALILERLGLPREARAQWQSYLEVDPSSQWAIEARAHLAKLDAPPPASNAQKMRTFGEAETLGRWAEAFQRGDDASAKRELDAARNTGDALIRASGESLLRDAVRAIDDAPNRATLAEAHAIYRRGRIAYSRAQLDAALADLSRAETLFGTSPMALVARYYAASVCFDRNEVDAARSQLQQVLAEADAHPSYIALGAQVRWELALALMVGGDWSGASPLLEQSCAAFRRLDERNHLGFVESLLADTLLSLGRPADAWSARIRAFELLSADGGGDRLPASIVAAVLMEIRSGRLENARSLLDVERSAARAASNDALLADILVQTALVNAALDDRAEAARTLREATEATERLRDPNAREVERPLLALAAAASIVKSEPARASEMLTRAIDAYRAQNRIVYLPECYLLRARAALAAGKPDAAEADLESGIDALEQSRIRTGSVVGTGVLNAGVTLFEDAIRLAANRGDVARAFAFAERSRTQLAHVRQAPSPVLSDLQHHLASSHTAVLELIPLPEQLITICVTASDAVLVRGRLTEQTPAALYDLIIKPLEPRLAATKELIIVAGRPLQNVPFAALYDSTSHRYLAERFAVSTAMSASTLQPAQPRAAGSLLAVGLPSGNATAGLPETAQEIAGITALYPASATIPPERATFNTFADAASNASVIHIAGHTGRPSDDAGTALLFAHDRVTWSAIALQHLARAPVVVLAACETLQQHAPANVRSLTLGDGFLAAGATDVVGTLTPIADADARDLFESIHRRLAAGVPPSEAVRGAQLEALARHSDAWRAVTLLTRCIH